MKKSTMAVIAALGLCAASGAQALTISDSFITPSQTTDLVDVTGTVAQFDDMGGTRILDGVSLEISAHAESTTSLTNTASNAQTFSYESSLTFLYSSIPAITGVDTNPLSGTIATTNGFVTLQPGDTLDLGTTTLDDAFTLTFAPSDADFAAFIGTGGIDITCNTLSGSNFIGGGGNIDTNQVTTAQCDATVTYTYHMAPTSVPLPGSLLLIGAGLLGFGASRRRK